jgi:hypothetical protein
VPAADTGLAAKLRTQHAAYNGKFINADAFIFYAEKLAGMM